MKIFKQFMFYSIFFGESYLGNYCPEFETQPIHEKVLLISKATKEC